MASTTASRSAPAASSSSAPAVVRPIKYEPFGGPQEFSDWMPVLFYQYRRYRGDHFPFAWLQKTSDLKVVCKDATAEEVDFPTPQALEDAIQSCASINDPPNEVAPPSLIDMSWTSRMDTTLWTVEQGLDLSLRERPPGGPLFDVLSPGLAVGSDITVKGFTLYRHRPNHWTYLVRDRSFGRELPDGKSYILRSEILAIVSIFYNQMNTVDFDPYKNKYVDRKLIYKDGLLTATIVTVLIGKVRVVQASCNPSDEYPTLTYTLRGFWDLRMSTYDKTTVQKVVKWMLCPPDPAQTQPVRAKKP